MSFRAQDTWTGQSVLLHQLLPEKNLPHQPDLTAMVFKHLTGATAPGTHHFVEIGQDEDRMFVVTTDVAECEDLRHWLQSLDASRESSGALVGSSTPQAAAPQPIDLDFAPTQMITDAPGRETPAAPTPSARQPGEFTLMFNTPSGTTKPTAESASAIDDVLLRPPSTPGPPGSKGVRKRRSPGVHQEVLRSRCCRAEGSRCGAPAQPGVKGGTCCTATWQGAPRPGSEWI